MILISMNIVATVLDSMEVQSFHELMLLGVKILLFWALIIVILGILIIKEDILVLGEDLTQRLGDTTITAEAKYPINFTTSGRRFVLSLHYIGSNSFLFVNVVKIYHV